ncbi:MAG: hypothetical protein QM504_14680 [Pseudomonadota bacterium]
MLIIYIPILMVVQLVCKNTYLNSGSHINTGETEIPFPLQSCKMKYFQYEIIACLFIYLLSASPVLADHKQTVLSDGMKAGPAFSNPDYIEPMDKNWQNQPIRYKKLPENTDLAITLDQHLYVALLPLINQFAKQHKLNIAVQEGTCGISAGSLYDKKVDMGGFCCPASETDRLPGLLFHTMAIASLAIITHPQNKVNNISLIQARQIFNGGLGYFSELSSNDKNNNQQEDELLIKPYTRMHCKLRPGHWRLLLNTEDDFSPIITELSTINDMIKQVATNKDAIGYETLWMMEKYSQNGKVTYLNIDNISPADNQALLKAKYPFYRTYNITSWAPKHLAKPDIKKLITYLMDNFKLIKSKYGLISATQLRKNGWKFKGDELIGEPE